MGKFDGIDFQVIEPELFLEGESVTGFSCARGEFRAYITGDRVARERAASVSQCWVLRCGGVVAGYITLLTDVLNVDDTPMLAVEGLEYRKFPAVKIGLLASDKRLLGMGIGKKLVMWAILFACRLSRTIGVRFLTVDALYDTDVEPPYDISLFYEKCGFEHVGNDPTVDGYKTMFLDLKPFIGSLSTEASGK